MQHRVLVAGSVMVASFAAYSLVSQLADLDDEASLAAFLGALSLLGLILLTAGAAPGLAPQVRQGLLVAGAVMVVSFLAYSAVDRSTDLADEVSAATVFGTLGALGLLLVVATTAVRRVRS